MKWLGLATLWACSLLGQACAQDGLAQRIPGSDVPRGRDAQAERRLALPRRAAEAETGSAFAVRLRSLTPQQREAALEEELLRGNVPDFLRRLVPVTLEGQARDGQPHRITILVTPDYLAVGDRDDFLRLPMTPRTAQRLADRLDCLLPTRAIVDAIHRQASVQLDPQPLSPGPEMVQPPAFARHQALIEAQRAARGAPLGALTAGHKKDLVLTPRLQQHPDRVAIYGWHRRDGGPIQPLSTVHASSYLDYSHGVRLVHRLALVDGRERPLADVLRDPVLWPLVSDEGPLAAPRVP